MPRCARSWKARVFFAGRCPIKSQDHLRAFFEIFQQMLTAVNPEADVSGEIRRLLRPVSGSREGEDAAPAAGQKYRLFNRIVQAMQDMYGFLSASSSEGEASASPLILVIDDVQWADPSTADLFSFLIGEARQNRLLVIGTLTIDSSGEAATEPGAPSCGVGAARARKETSRSSASRAQRASRPRTPAIAPR